MPHSVTFGCAAARISFSSARLPNWIGGSEEIDTPVSSIVSSFSAIRSLSERTTSMRSWRATTLRVSLPRMSSSRETALRSSRRLWKYLSGSAIRQRAKVSTTINSLSRVVISVGGPSHSRIRFSKRFTVWIIGSLKWRPAPLGPSWALIAALTGLPNCVTITCSVSSMV